MRETHRFLTLYVVLIVLALASFLGLDFIAWKEGEKSVVFPAFSSKKKISENKKDLIHIVKQNLLSIKIPEKDINQYTDEYGICHIMVSLNKEKYNFIEKNLEESFHNIKASIEKKSDIQKKEKHYFLWEINKKGQIPLSLLFSIEFEKEREKPDQQPVYKNNVALIIDDMGYSMDDINDICSLKKNLTIAVLPFSPYAEETATLASQNGLEVILHLPLESMNNIYDNEHTSGLINTRMDPKEILDVLNTNLKQVPFISGVNTHMGSKVTQNKMLMRIILGNLKEKNLYFIDSRTTAHSVAYDVAQKMNIPSAYRKVFLDSKNEPKYIKNQLIKLFKTAEKEGNAVGIGHPFPNTLQVLKENIHEVKNYRVNLVFASKIVH